MSTTPEPLPSAANDRNRTWTPDNAAELLVATGSLVLWGSILLAGLRLLAMVVSEIQGRPLSFGSQLSELCWSVAGIVSGITIRSVLIGFAVLLTTLARLRIEPSSTQPAVADLKAQRLAACHQAIRSGQWADADLIVRTFVDTHPDDPESTRLTEELAVAKNSARQELLAKLDAARQVNDPDRVIELRESLKPLIEIDVLKSLDRDLAKWFMTIIQRRLRAGTVRPDVAMLAGRVAETLDDTPEGASLRASLPTLRRAAGLCARCAQPYTGIADACPTCLTGIPAQSPFVTPETDEPE